MIALIVVSPIARGGVSAENVIVVVNGKSPASRTIANHYVEARNIPHGNVVILPAVPDGLKASLSDFKTRILTPTLQQIDARGLSDQVKVIAYSADFPTSIDIREHTAKLKDPGLVKYQSRIASINGATYFYRFVNADNEGYLSFGSNLYSRGVFAGYFLNPFGGDEGARFERALAALPADPLQAAEAFQEMGETYPTLAPIWIRSAEAYLAAGDRAAATKMLKRAIQAGWKSATYLKQHLSLSKLLSDQELARVLPILADAPTQLQLPAAFSAQRSWTRCGFSIPAAQGGMMYMMSCSLAVLHKRGSKLDQAIEVLQRAAQADRTFPDGEFRFADHSDVRARSRKHGFDAAVELIDHVGYRGIISQEVVPAAAGDVSGLMLGSAEVSFEPRAWSFVPGAISETLTSYAGAFGHLGQTKLTKYLHAGAAISSGAVDEPYSLQAKFPRPQMYGYYAQGASAIESYYLSVDSPYQLLIVGDPVCQPYANPPGERVRIEKVHDAHRLQVQVRTPVNPSGVRWGDQAANGAPLQSIEIYLGGRLQTLSKPAATINVDFPDTLSGMLETRVVLVGLDPTEPRMSFSKVVDLQGERSAPVATITQTRADGRPNYEGLASDGTKSKAIIVQLNCPGADAIELMHHEEVVGSLEGSAGSLKVATHRLGGGPLRLIPVAKFGNQRVLGRAVVDRFEPAPN